MRDYEVLYIVRADLDDDKVQDVIKRVNTLIERSGEITEEVLRHLIVRKPEKAAPAPAVAPPPAEVILEPIAVETEAVAGRSNGDREED